jgi:hypothetical protein
MHSKVHNVVLITPEIMKSCRMHGQLLEDKRHTWVWVVLNLIIAIIGVLDHNLLTLSIGVVAAILHHRHVLSVEKNLLEVESIIERECRLLGSALDSTSADLERLEMEARRKNG